MNLLHANDQHGRYPDSWYAATATDLAPFPPLQGAQNADVCVIGAGFTGLSAALHLAQAGYDVAVIEAHRVGWGASGRNGGQVGSGQRADQRTLESMVGKSDARLLWDISEDAKALVKSLIDTHNIPAAWKPGIAHVTHRAKEVPDYHEEAEFMASNYGYDQIEPLDRAATRALVGSDKFEGGSIDRGGAHIHPLNYAIGLAKAAADAGAHIYEMSEVTGLTKADPANVSTDKGTVTASHVLLACNGYLGALEDDVAARVMPINNFIATTEPLSDDAATDLIREDVAVCDAKFVLNYWRRSADNRLVFGGGETYGYRFPNDIRALVKKPLVEIYPQMADVKLDYAWGGTLAITVNRMPCFRRVTGNILSASGYSGHGVAMATMGGKLMSDVIRGQAEKFDAMARVPTHEFPGGRALRSPTLFAAMTFFALRDRLGI
ncbi:MAG: FAD-binding oxidoreductase [Pseudomonadota bacterium]